MFKYSKTLLSEVFFDKYLFSKELRKLVFSYVDDTEQKTIFFQWCLKNFGDKYLDVICNIFEDDHSLNDDSQVEALLMFLESKK